MCHTFGEFSQGWLICWTEFGRTNGTQIVMRWFLNSWKKSLFFDCYKSNICICACLLISESPMLLCVQCMCLSPFPSYNALPSYFTLHFPQPHLPHLSLQQPTAPSTSTLSLFDTHCRTVLASAPWTTSHMSPYLLPPITTPCSRVLTLHLCPSPFF